MSKILVVDDEKDILKFLSEELARRGYEVDTASSGEEAVEKAKAIRPDLVLMDMRMPGMGGMKALEQVKEIDPQIEVIMVTAVHDEDAIRKATDLGVDDYVTKPVDFSHLNEVVMEKIANTLA